MDFTALAKQIHEENRRWWYDSVTGEKLPPAKERHIALMHSELSEAFLGLYRGVPDSHLPDFREEFVEIADFTIRALDYAAGYGVDLSPINRRVLGMASVPNIMLLRLHSATSGLLEAVRRGQPEAVPLANMLYLAVQYAKVRRFDLFHIMEEKRKYNQSRADHALEVRARDGGKKF